jgi:arsenite-transporting ATPase
MPDRRPTLEAALDRPIVFFGGKGGVGKTTLASAAALESAAAGVSTLLVSTDPAHSTSDILGRELGSNPTAVVADLWAMEIDPAAAADAYIAEVKARLAETTPPRLVAEVERQIDLARVSPGSEEAAVFERFSRILEDEGRFGRVIFDTAPTGQTLRLLSLPELMSAWIGGLVSRRRKVSSLGRMWRNVAGAAAGSGAAGAAGRESAGAGADRVLEALEQRQARFHRARRVLTDPDRTAFVFVVIPDRLPILETHRAVSTLWQYGIPVGGLVVNRLLPAAPNEGFLKRRQEREAAHLADIEERFGDWPIAYAPLLDDDPTGVEALRDLYSRIRTEPTEASG